MSKRKFGLVGVSFIRLETYEGCRLRDIGIIVRQSQGGQTYAAANRVRCASTIPKADNRGKVPTDKGSSGKGESFSFKINIEKYSRSNPRPFFAACFLSQSRLNTPRSCRGDEKRQLRIKNTLGEKIPCGLAVGSFILL